MGISGVFSTASPQVSARSRNRAHDIILTNVELAEIARTIPPDAAAGARYPAAQMAMLDSEKHMVRA